MCIRDRPPPGEGEVQVRIKAVALNHLDLWGFRGMAFTKRKLPLVVGAEASGEIAAAGAGVSLRDAACAPIAFGTTEHMLFDNAKLKPGETILVHAGGSGIGSVAIKMAKALGCTVITTVGDDSKAEKARALGADHVINYKTERFEGVTRKLTAKKGVDVVFEHVGGEGFNASLFCLKRGGRAAGHQPAAGPNVTINLMQLFQQQYKIFGSFGASIRNIRDSLSKIATGMAPIIDSEFALADFETGLARLESRQVFGKVIVNF